MNSTLCQAGRHQLPGGERLGEVAAEAQVIGQRDELGVEVPGVDHDPTSAGVVLKVGAPEESGEPSRRYRIDDNVLARLEQGIVLEQTTRAQLRGNLFDGVGDGLVLDGAGHGAEVTGNIFLRASRWFIDAPDLAAGGNYWATADASGASSKVKGRISVLPWKPASAAGY